MGIREDFINEINNIDNPVWKEACINLVNKLPAYFWVTPASTSGKYHPKCDLGEGGLVRHSIMVCQIATDLVTAEIFVRDTVLNRDKAIIAALFHDSWKLGDGSENHTKFEHPLIASQWLHNELFNIIDSSALADITRAVATHMGKWVTSKYSDTVLEKPITDFEKLIHTADYMASRKYIQFKNDTEDE